MADNERKYLAVSVKHSEYRWKYGMPCVLWGERSKDGEARSFSGYTLYPEEAELYALDDFDHYPFGIIRQGPVALWGNTRFMKENHEWDTVLVFYDDYIQYCNVADLPLRRGAK